jgi:hypothetical protein
VQSPGQARVRIDMSERDAWALLGTPNGRGPAWMLIQHKEQLGLKTFSAVTIFAIDNKISLCFWIRDAGDQGLNLEIPQDLQDPSGGDTGRESIDEPVRRSLDVAINNNTMFSILEVGERLTTALRQRIVDLTMNCWTALRLF